MSFSYEVHVAPHAKPDEAFQVWACDSETGKWTHIVSTDRASRAEKVRAHLEAQEKRA